jgi:hypothetical protein
MCGQYGKDKNLLPLPGIELINIYILKRIFFINMQPKWINLFIRIFIIYNICISLFRSVEPLNFITWYVLGYGIISSNKKSLFSHSRIFCTSWPSDHADDRIIAVRSACQSFFFLNSFIQYRKSTFHINGVFALPLTHNKSVPLFPVNPFRIWTITA